MLKKAFGVDCLSDRQIFRWHKAFAEGREDVNDENSAGRPSTSSSDDNVKKPATLLVGQLLAAQSKPLAVTPMKGQHFGSVKNIQKACTDALKAIPENDYRAAFDAWKTRWNRCVDAGEMI
ncbi:hypothetical protein NQ318_011745 [Aromia moschata]|uniref:Mos1 transposase HTH domain-containing protein n=1 Tax=Aromia moschata TaxID=1265417 RepID=A0AAV8Y0C8_9CUCU|nr:hypothetical protein NQ318_011745 [Aromia moschata]